MLIGRLRGGGINTGANLPRKGLYREVLTKEVSCRILPTQRAQMARLKRNYVCGEIPEVCVHSVM
jgi:hypothetical protein